MLISMISSDMAILLITLDNLFLCQIVIAPRNSLNNRFLPLSNIETEAVLNLDDDIRLSKEEIELGFR